MAENLTIVDETPAVVTVTARGVEVPVRTDAVQNALVLVYLEVIEDDTEDTMARMGAMHKLMRALIGPGYVRYIEQAATDGVLSFEDYFQFLTEILGALEAKN